MKDIILVHKSYKIPGKYRVDNKPLKYSTSESQYSSHPNYMKMWICSASCLNITENRNTNMVVTREKTLTSFYKGKNNKCVLIQNNTKLYALKLMKQTKCTGFFSKVS